MADSITRKNIDLDILDYYDGKIKNYVDNKVGTGSLTIDDTLSDTSTNPVQNKIVKQAIDNKADSNHTHVKADITDFPASLPANGGDAATVNGHTVESNVPALGYYYATCDSPLTTNIKTVTCEGFEFKEGARITVCFTTGSGGNPPSTSVYVLKINEDAGRPIAYNDWDGEGIISGIDSKKSEAFCSNQVWDFIFIKGRFIMQAPLRGYQMDDTLSDRSRNPVQNKTIKAELDNKADKTVATTETDGLMSAEDKGKLDNADNTYALKSKYGDSTINVGRKSGTTVGKYSTAEGNNTTASGWTSHAEGDGTTASGDYSHAEGKLTTASGYASHTEGNATTASSDYSHAEGKSTAASGLYSHAEGRGTTASGNNSHAEGATTAASNYAAHAEGNETTASGNSSHAEGQSTTASGNNSHAEGNNTTASGNNSHAEGYSSDKVTQLITDFLNGNITKDDIINTWKTKKFSVAHGNESHVEGQDNLSLGHYSHTEGLYTVAIGDQSHTSGYYTKALHDNEAAYGKYNESNDDTLFSVGDGTADDARHNAFEITTTGGKLHDKDIATTDLIPTSLPANGGDADTVGGKSPSDFLPFQAYAPIYTGDIKDISNMGTYSCYKGNCTNLPDIEMWAYVIMIRFRDAGYKTFLCIEFNPTPATQHCRNIYIAREYDVDSSGNMIWYKACDGGNADTIDGLHASDITASFALKSLYSDTTINVGRRAGTKVGDYSTAEGFSTEAGGTASHAEGGGTRANSQYSHAEGGGTTASGNNSHAEGHNTTASGNYSHSEGANTTASSNCSHAEGLSTTASGHYAHAEGYITTAANIASHAGGHCNVAMATDGTVSNTSGTAFVIGNGTSFTALSNAFSVQFDGTVKAKSTITASTTADYAEFFEWLDSNPDNEDRVGYFVTLDGNKIRIATNEDDYILGVVSGEPFVLGNGDCDTWNGMFLRDEFRRTIYEPAPKMVEILDSEGNPTGEFEEVEGEFEGTRPKLNPEYDHTQVYISRFDRKEWAPVGMLGVLAVRHDGTAVVNGYVTVNADGIATACDKNAENSYRVIKANSDSVVEIIFR